MAESSDKITAAACSRQDCNGCEIQGKLLCVHTSRDLMDFFVLFMGWVIPFLSGMIIAKYWSGLAVWVALVIIFFGYVEALVLCRHCPHYMEDGFLLRCHANWGLPKIPRINPRPLNTVEKVVWLAYVALLFLYYIPFFIISRQWLLLILTTSALVVAGWTLRRTQCNRCFNLSCPINCVPEDVRDVFFRNYPEYARAWGKNDQNRT